MLDEQSRHLAYLLDEARRREVTVIEASAEAEAEWVRTIETLARNNLAFLEACTPGYYNNEGRPAERSVRNSSFGAGPVAFVKVLADWRAAGDLAGLELS
jgi:hypothetical protein